MHVSEAAHLKACLRDVTTTFLHPENRFGVRTPSTVIALHEGCVTYSPAQISFTECNIGTRQKLPYGISTTNELKYVTNTPDNKGSGSSVSIATDYGLDGPNPGGDEIFRPSRPTLWPTQPPVKWVPGLSRGVNCGRGVLLTTHPLLVPRSWKSRAIPLPTLWATLGL